MEIPPARWPSPLTITNGLLLAEQTNQIRRSMYIYKGTQLRGIDVVIMLCVFFVVGTIYQGTHLIVWNATIWIVYILVGLFVYSAHPWSMSLFDSRLVISGPHRRSRPIQAAWVCSMFGSIHVDSVCVWGDKLSHVKYVIFSYRKLCQM